MTYRELSDWLRQFPAVPQYDDAGEMYRIQYTLDNGDKIYKSFKFIGEDLDEIRITGKLPTGVTSTVQKLTFTGDDLAGINFT